MIFHYIFLTLIKTLKLFHINQTYKPLIAFQSIPINTIKFIPINNQKTGVNNSFLMPNRIASNNKTITPINIQKKVVSVILILFGQSHNNFSIESMVKNIW